MQYYTHLQSIKDNKERGTLFEKLTKRYLENTDTYDVQKVSYWSEWEHKERSTDLGIDLVIEQNDGDFIAVQCKCHDKDSLLQDKDVVGLLSLSSKTFNGHSFSSSLLVTTASGVNSNAEKKLKNQNPPCTVVGFHELPELTLEEELSEPRPLRKYQEEAIASVRKGFEKEDKGKLIMACGTGKTITSLRLMESMTPKTVLILAPSLNLVSQLSQEYSKNRQQRQRHLIVCSDHTIKSQGDSDFIHDSSGCPSTTDKDKIRRFLQTKTPFINIIFSTYQSLPVIEEAYGDSYSLCEDLPKFDLVICDESHNIAGKGNTLFTKVIEESFQKYYKKILFMTATPRLYTESSKEKAKLKNYELLSMDDESVYGKEFYNYTFKRAIEEDNLCDYEVLVLKLKASKGVPTDDEHFFEVYNHIKNKDILECLENTFEEYGLNKVISFSSKIANSKSFKASIEEHKDSKILVEHVDGKQKTNERKNFTHWLGEDYRNPDKEQYKYKILSNARCLSEGVDVPSVNGVMFLNPKRTAIDIIQSIGRAIRKSPNKKKGYIILPLIIPEKDDDMEALKDSIYRPIVDVLVALRSYNDQEDLKKLLKTNVRFIDYDHNNSIETDKNPEDHRGTQQYLFDFEEALYTELVNVETFIRKAHLQSWFNRVPPLLTKLRSFYHKEQDHHQKKIGEIHKVFQETVNPEIPKEAIGEVFLQHVLTSSILNEVFLEYGFIHNNPIAKLFTELEQEFLSSQDLQEMREIIKRSREALRKIVHEDDTFHDKYTFLIQFYEGFYHAYDEKQAKADGVVYTPKEVIDFMITSTDSLLQTHFNGKTLASKGVDILEPSCGTGSFVFHTLDYIANTYSKEDAIYKYNHELHANEINILAYYIATLCIESKYYQITNTYKPYEKIVLQDTLGNEDHIKEESSKTESMFKEDELNNDNIKRRRDQTKAEMTVILGNPPYRAGQRNANDNNATRKYPVLDERIEHTYAKEGISTSKNALYDLYVRFIRWSTDRIGEKGILAFISNNSFLDAKSFDGFRKVVEQEFDVIYSIDLHGDIRKQKGIGEPHTVFGRQSSTGVCITFFIKKGEPLKEKADILYRYVGESTSTRVEKFQYINETLQNNIQNIQDFQTITPNKKYYWLNTEETDFENHIPVVSKDKTEKTIFQVNSRGIGTSRDSWVYDHDETNLQKKMEYFIDTYHELLEQGDKEAFDDDRIKWTDSLKNYFNKKRKIDVFGANKMVTSLFRPYSKQTFYAGKMMNDRLTQNHYQIFGHDLQQENVCIGFTPPPVRGDFGVLSTILVPNLCSVDTLNVSTNLPLHTYTPDGDKVENITTWALETFQDHYNDQSITKEDIFHYIYAVFHNDDYLSKYKVDLQRSMPRIPTIKTDPKYKEFHGLAKLGKELMHLHINFEEVEPYGSVEVIEQQSTDSPSPIMKKNQSTVYLDNQTTIQNIPLEAYDYKLGSRSPIDWILDQHSIKNPSKTQKDNYRVIYEQFNTPQQENKRYQEISRPYLMDLIPRLVTVSMKTLEIKRRISGI